MRREESVRATAKTRAVPWFEAALAVRGLTRRRQGRRLGAAVLAAALCLGVAGAGSAAPAARSSVFTGYGFEACNAPSTDAMTAWLQSPYRAVGIYIGGTNRTCSNANLSSTWVSTVQGMGWSLIPTYVGLQAPCVTSSRARFTAANAQAQGVAAADDAIARATALGLSVGSPIYYDMEAYALKDLACTQAVQTFVSAWTSELHARGWTSGVYGSAASTMRDMGPLAGTPGGPDAIWIGNWNGSESVFGDPYVSDTLWTNHQRIHQYRGGHKETWGGVSIDIDNDYVDAPVVGGAPVAPQPSPQPNPNGSVGTPDGMATVTWPPGTIDGDTDVQLDPTVPGVTLPGYGTGGYGVALQASSFTTLKPLRSFAVPVTLQFAPRTGRLAPVYSTNGTVWKHVPLLVDDAIGPGARTGYTRNDQEGFVIKTSVPGWFALVPDRVPPAPPANVTGRFLQGSLTLAWAPATDANGPVVGYRITLTNRTIWDLPRRARSQRVGGFHLHGPSVYRVVALDAAGNESRPSQPIVVLPSKRPKKLPKAIPAWAWRLAAWDHQSARPEAPKQVPEWYWRWARWQALPFHLRGQA